MYNTPTQVWHTICNIIDVTNKDKDMYVLIKKVPDGYRTSVETLAYSENKEELMELLPFEVERYVRSRCKKMLPHEMRFYLPHGHEPLEVWERGAFGCEEFRVMEIRPAIREALKCSREIARLKEENKEYLQKLGLA